MADGSGSELTGRVAVVTGAGRGIGRVLAVALARRGMRVALAARSADQLDAVVKEIGEDGGEAVAVVTDVTDPAQMTALVDTAASRWGRLDVMVNNAGTIRYASLVDTSPDDLDAILSTNVRGVFLGMQAALRAMTKGGSIVNMASTFGTVPVRGYAAYCASKAAILQLTKVAAAESARDGIRVNAIAPGYVETDFNTEALADPATRGAIERKIPLQRVITADELVPITAYLCSDDSAYCTGSVFTIDGGFALR